MPRGMQVLFLEPPESYAVRPHQGTLASADSPKPPSRPDRRLRSALALTALILAAAPLLAQDTRQVIEPHIPPTCALLDAHLSAPNGRLSPSAEQNIDTARIQAALDACTAGHAVELRGSSQANAFLAGPLQLRPGVTLLVDAGVTLLASRDPRLYDLTPGSCGIVDGHGHGCKPLILADRAPGSAIMGDGVIDGRGGDTLLGQNQSWWDLAHVAKITNRYQNCFRLVIVRHSDNFTLYRITLHNSPNFHVSVEQTDGFTAWGVKIDTPRTARNTDGIDPSSSTNVSILYSWIRDGDDNVAIKAGSNGPSTHITVAHDHFYSGHGMSIGSETNGGVSAVRVDDLTIDGADNGIRIKSDPSRGGLVRDVSYDDICMRDVKNPILLTPAYSAATGNLLPQYRDITLRDVHILTPGRITIDGLDDNHKITLTLDNVFADSLQPASLHAAFADITVGPNAGNLIPFGQDVHVTRAPGSHPGTPLDCGGRFAPFPSDAAKP